MVFVHLVNCKAFGRVWYIKDRFIANKIYEYCLMSVSAEKPLQYKFTTLSDFAKWLNEDSSKSIYNKEVAMYIIRRSIIYVFSDVAMVEKNGLRYRRIRLK